MPNYCKAYLVGDLMKYPAWSVSDVAVVDVADSESASPLGEEDVVFLHEDLTVTRSMWHGEDVVFDAVTPEWQSFCRDTLEFAVPDDLLTDAAPKAGSEEVQ